MLLVAGDHEPKVGFYFLLLGIKSKFDVLCSFQVWFELSWNVITSSFQHSKNFGNSSVKLFSLAVLFLSHYPFSWLHRFLPFGFLLFSLSGLRFTIFLCLNSYIVFFFFLVVLVSFCTFAYSLFVCILSSFMFIFLLFFFFSSFLFSALILQSSSCSLFTSSYCYTLLYFPLLRKRNHYHYSLLSLLLIYYLFVYLFIYFKRVNKQSRQENLRKRNGWFLY